MTRLIAEGTLLAGRAAVGRHAAADVGRVVGVPRRRLRRQRDQLLRPHLHRNRPRELLPRRTRAATARRVQVCKKFVAIGHDMLLLRTVISVRLF